ncbi:hypothetical protein ACFL35_21895 [Candidatus Riflebacteria bacterium]
MKRIGIRERNEKSHLTQQMGNNITNKFLRAEIVRHKEVEN